jgi:hypothetical protein
MILMLRSLYARKGGSKQMRERYIHCMVGHSLRDTSNGVGMKMSVERLDIIFGEEREWGSGAWALLIS